MPKAKYHFDTSTLRYEKVVVPLGKRILRVSGWVVSAFVFGAVVLLVAYSYVDSPKEKQLRREINQLVLQYEILQQRVSQSEAVLRELNYNDDNIYRIIFEAEPIPASVRKAGYGGINKYSELERYDNAEIMIESSMRVDKLMKQLYIQSKSFDEIFGLARQKTQMLASIPGIQPVSNKDLKRIASGYGYRIHPIYKTYKMHYGQDFTAPVGTEVYATGNGTVYKVENSRRGYGRSIIINHGYGYRTLYAHLSKIEVRRGQKVQRGDLIGLVGNTGTSTAPHLHYEVIKNNRKINPANFFYNDLTPEEYEQMLELSSRVTQSFD